MDNDVSAEWTRREFYTYLGYPQTPMCPACKGIGDHRLKDGTGFYCQIDHTKPHHELDPE